MVKCVPLLLALATTPVVSDCGIASWYEHGRTTASGQRFVPGGMTAAHKSLRFGTKLNVHYKGKQVVVTVNDKGPFVKGRVLDLSRGAAKKLGLSGVGRVCYERL